MPIIKRSPLKVRLKMLARRSLLRIRRPRSCLECGFLAFGEEEATREDRESLGFESLNHSLVKFHCFLSCWTDCAVYGWSEDSVRRELEADRRDCPSFFRHRRGWTPNEHRELVSKRWDTKRQIIITVFGSFLGSALTLLVGWLAWRIGIK